jgi:G3E family GTPase
MTKLIFVGGFLGAGKTTLIYEVTQILSRRGLNVGLITNDQAPDLADTSLLGHINFNVTEVSGSCFCCDFKGLRKAVERIEKNQKMDIIIAEPVGSCTDLSATLINPIKDILKAQVTVSPLTVLADPKRLEAILAGDEKSDLHPSAVYIIKKQLEESDIIAVSKTDLYSTEEIKSLTSRLKKNFPECEIREISARSGYGIEEWINTVLKSEDAGRHIPEIDYDKYAEGEAVLGWLNCSASLSGEEVDWDMFTRTFMQDLAERFDEKNSPVGHVKMMVERGDRYISANLTGTSESLSLRWSAGTGNSAEMVVNARVEMPPEELEKIFMDTLQRTANGLIKSKINRLSSLSPGYPRPTYRYGRQ